MGADPMLTALAMHRCSESYWTKTALRNGFVSYKFASRGVFALEDEIGPASKRPRGATVTPTSVTLPVVPVLYRGGFRVSPWSRRSAIMMSAVQWAEIRLGAAERKVLANLIGRSYCSKNCWGHAGDTDDVTEETLAATREAIQAVGHKVPVSKKGYVKLFKSLATDMPTAWHGAKATTEKLAARKTSVSELDREV